MKQLFVCLGVACLLLGAGLVVPRPAHAIPPFDCTMTVEPITQNNTTLLTDVFTINETTSYGTTPVPENATPGVNSCIIELGNFGFPAHFGDIYQNSTTTTIVSDYVDTTALTGAGCIISPCTTVTLTSDPSSPEGALSPRQIATDRLIEDANGVAQLATGGLPCDPITTDPKTGATQACLRAQSDTDLGPEVNVPEPSTGLLLGTVLPGLFGFRRFSRGGR